MFPYEPVDKLKQEADRELENLYSKALGETSKARHLCAGNDIYLKLRNGSQPASHEDYCRDLQRMYYHWCLGFML